MTWLPTLDGFDWRTLMVTWGLKLAAAAVILVVGLHLARWITALAEWSACGWP